MPQIEIAGASITQRDYSLHGQGSQDEARHNEKVKEAIINNLGGVISDGSIVTADPRSKRTIRIPLRALDLPHIRHGRNNKGGIGTGNGGEEVGDVIDRRPVDGKGGKEAGTDPGEETYDAELTIEEIKELVFADMGLPFLAPKKSKEMETDTLVFNDVRKKRSPTNLDIVRTVQENMRRNALNTGHAEIARISPDDYRVRTWRQEVREDNAAVVISMADISGSMGDQEKYLTRVINWWGGEFLRSEYPRVENVYVVHDTQAHEVSEADFYKRGDGGGTICSSAAELALKIVEARYSPDAYNVYLQHYSDGGNYDSDNTKYVDLIQRLLNLGISHFAYINIGEEGTWGNLRSALSKGIQDDRFLSTMIKDKTEVRSILQQIYDPTKQTAA